MRCLFFFCCPIRGISPGESSRRLASRVRICRSKIGERLAQRDILQAESVQILAKGEIPVCPVVACAQRTIGFAFAAKPSESDSHSEAFSSGKRANSRRRRDSRVLGGRAQIC